ncbi:hypothetical protein MBAV_000038 [Candidatus Magnetobacterium bavaricum]|uniref:Uncharacterized protein n=1 Tax=Candidatus Magnetobacterium bavaricum TaxID=29290 RepID=A0A0F3H0Y9_9BACT|nr:hypothetical protein MBAV_000038 [Candidatus Magnetobacterium bavaricum]
MATMSGTSSAMKPMWCSSSVLYLKETGSSLLNASMASSDVRLCMSFLYSRLEAFVHTPPVVT